MIGVYQSNGLVSDFNAYYDATNSFGICIEYKFSKHWGVGGNVNLHNYNFNNANTNFMYSTIPIYIKYYSSFLNISALMFAESYVNKKGNIIFSDISPLNNFGDFNYGLGLSISKQFNLTKKIIFEPDIKLISNSIDGLNTELSIGIGLLYRL